MCTRNKIHAFNFMDPSGVVANKIFSCVLAPHGKLPMGSVVLIGSLSHLGHFRPGQLCWQPGQGAVVTVGRGGGGVNVGPHTPIPWGGGVNDEATIRALLYLDS
jgi:hypothetical protein